MFEVLANGYVYGWSETDTATNITHNFFLLILAIDYPSLWLFLPLHDCDCFLWRALLPHKYVSFILIGQQHHSPNYPD